MMRNKKANWMVGEHLLALIVTVLVSLVIISLLYMLFFNVKGNSELKKVEGGLNEIISSLENRDGSHIDRSLYEWYVFSYEFGDFCEGAFCFCACNEDDCQKLRVCIATEKFVALKENTKGVRFIELDGSDGVTEINIGFVEGKIYPYSEAISINELQKNELDDLPKTVYYRFDDGRGEWEWSLNVLEWYGVDENSIIDSEIKNRFDKEFAKSLQDESLVGGENEFIGARVSDGVYIVSKK